MFPNPRIDIRLLNHYSSIIQQIELQNQLLGNIIRENNTIKEKILSYCKDMNNENIYNNNYGMNLETCYNQLNYYTNLALHMPPTDLNQGTNTQTRVKREEWKILIVIMLNAFLASKTYSVSTYLFIRIGPTSLHNF